MRNLKKILALVLALVMSLSLMATAGASSFPDVDAENPYATAIEVLDELKVFQGYKEDGTFRPTETLNRAQAAVLVYRIATGDVEDKYLDNYTYMQQSKFTDLDGYNWAKGYINYCQNAGIVVGTSATTFDPGAKVTGYQLLVMLLRTLGYGKAGEFADPKGWELQTATIAEREGITKNVTTGDFGAPAPRQMVAEILFRGLLTETVEYSALTPGGYTKGETLGMREFKLEEIEGVVVANEFADLYSSQVLAEGRTNLEVAEDDIRSLAITTEITDIGESRYAYISGSKVLAMGDTGNNKVTETGAAVDIDSTSKFNAVAEMPAASDIEYYVNFEDATAYDCDYRLEFKVTFQSATAENSFNRYISNNIAWIAANESDWDVTWTAVPDTDPVEYTYPVTYHKIIRAGVDISTDDLDVIRGIFGAADNAPGLGDNDVVHQIDGDVYVGTKSTNTTTTITLPGGGTGVITTNGEQDVSNLISYNTFFEEYINVDEDDQYWNQSYNGYWVKFVDNNGDGKCEYAFLTWSWLDEAIGAYTNKDDQTITEFNNFDDDDDPRAVDGDYQVRYLNDYTPAVGDKVIAARIDNQVLVEPAKSENVTVSDYSWREDKITTDKGEYGQSGIGNATDMQQRISGMEDKVEYTVYFDHFGFVRAYELPGGTKYALVTELYYTNSQNGNLVKDWPMTVELTMPNEEGAAETKEYTTSSSNVFNTQQFLSTPWFEVTSIAANRSYYNWLQPAIAHLGVGYTDSVLGWRGALNAGASSVATPDIDRSTQYRFWDKNYQAINTITNFGTIAGSKTDVSMEFRYGTQKYDQIAPSYAENVDVANTTSFTNVAVVNANGDNATLSGAAKLHVDRNGRIDASRYDVDYIQLSTADIAKGAVRYNVGGDPIYQGNNNNFVNAVHDTEYYIVYNGGVFYCKDYVNFPGLTNEKNNIHAAYAVARDTRSDNANQPYWVADVIVYEVENLDDTAKSNIALAYYTQQRNTGSVQLLKTLNSKYGPMVDLVPGGKNWNAELGQWGNALLSGWENYGFYQLYNTTEPVDGQMAARSIDLIDEDFNKNGIYAGTIIREVEVDSRGDYIVVEIEDNTGLHTVQVEVTDKIYGITHDANIDGNWYNEYNTARQLRYKNTNSPEVKTGDRVIWVGSAATDGTVSSASFVVDLGNWETNRDLWNTTARFLAQYGSNPATNDEPTSGLWRQIVDEQAAKYVAPEYVDLNLVLANGETAEISVVDGSSATVKGDGTPAGKVTTLSVPGQKYSFTLNIKLTGNNPVDLAAVTVGGGWTAGAPVMNNTNAAGTEKTYTVLVSRSALPSALLSASFVPAADADLRVYSAAGAQALATWANTPTNLTALADAELVALSEVLTDLHTALPAGDLKDSVNTAKSAVDAKVEEIEEEAAAALAEAKEGLDEAITALIDGQESAEITAAKSALTEAIDACKTVEEVQVYYKDGALVVTDEKVAALAEAVQAAKDAAAADPNSVANIKSKALAAVDAMFEGTGVAVPTEDGDLKTAYDNMVNAIKACTGVEASADVPTKLALKTYVTVTEAEGAVTVAIIVDSEGLGKTLKTAIETAKSEAEAEKTLDIAKADAKLAITEAVGSYGDVPAVKEKVDALIDLIDKCEVGGSNTTLITTFFETGALKESQENVKAVLDAVAAAELAANKELAIAAVDALFTEAGVEKPEYDENKTSEDTLQGKYSALVKLINDCTVDGSDTTALSTYWTDNGLEESQAAVAALITKIEAAQTPVQP